MMQNPIIKRLIYLFIDFLNLIFLHFDLAAPIQRGAVLFFTSDMLVKRHSDFPELGFLTGVDVM